MTCACLDLSSELETGPSRRVELEGCREMEALSFLLSDSNRSSATFFSAAPRDFEMEACCSGGDDSSSDGTGASSAFSLLGTGLAARDILEPASNCRGCIEEGLVKTGLTGPPLSECLLAFEIGRFVTGGGPIEDFPVVLSLDLVLESEIRAVVAGVVVRGVEAVELADESAGFEGDLVGD